MLVVVDYGLGNLYSVNKIFEALGVPVSISSDPEVILQAERIVLPGVGAFGDGMRNLEERKLIPVLNESVRERGTPFLGICLGMQLLAESSNEYGEHSGLGWIRGKVVKLNVAEKGFKIPHIGWNQIILKQDHPLFKGLAPMTDFYFVHSYEFQPSDQKDLLAISQYGKDITAAVGRKNIAGVQFHPEKSQDNGLKLMENFITWKP